MSTAPEPSTALAIPLATERLILEPLAVDHAGELYEVLRDEALYRDLDESPPASAEALRERYRRQVAGPPAERVESWFNWIVRLRDAGGDPATAAPAIGFVQATVLADRVAWIGFVIGRPWQGHGHAGEAAAAMLVHLAIAGGVRRFLATTESRNEASIRVLARLGFTDAVEDDLAVFPPGPTERLFVRPA